MCCGRVGNIRWQSSSSCSVTVSTTSVAFSSAVPRPSQIWLYQLVGRRSGLALLGRLVTLCRRLRLRAAVMGSRRAAARGTIRVFMTNFFQFLRYSSVTPVEFWDLQRFCRAPVPSAHRRLSYLSLPLCRAKRRACPAYLPNLPLSRSISSHVLRPSW